MNGPLSSANGARMSPDSATIGVPENGSGQAGVESQDLALTSETPEAPVKYARPHHRCQQVRP